jgi:hypothetical protein
MSLPDDISLDAELEALRQAMEALLSVDEKTRARIINYLVGRFLLAPQRASKKR